MSKIIKIIKKEILRLNRLSALQSNSRQIHGLLETETVKTKDTQ